LFGNGDLAINAKSKRFMLHPYLITVTARIRIKKGRKRKNKKNAVSTTKNDLYVYPKNAYFLDAKNKCAQFILSYDGAKIDIFSNTRLI